VSEVREFRLPDLGEGLTEAEIATWRVAVGDVITLNQVIAEVETEKAVVELPSPFAGTVLELKVEQGATVTVGSPIIAVDVGEQGASSPDPAATHAATPVAPEAEEKVAVLVGYGPAEARASRRRRRGSTASASAPAASPTPTPTPPKARAHLGTLPTPSGPHARSLATPPVRYLARQQDVDLADVQGTGPGGVITRDDVTNYVANRTNVVTPAPATRSAPSPAERETRTAIHGVRRLTAEAMVRSAFTAPHVTEFVTVDVTPTMELIEQLKQSSVFEGVKVTPLTLVAKALLLALRDSPSLNSSWDEDAQEIVTKHYVNLGIAAATPRGLMVPNIKDAHQMSLRDLARSLAELTTTAREGRSAPADLSGGTITITNIGVFGVDGGTPILNPGEAAILCVGRVRRQPWEYQGDIALREVATLSLSFDHRLVDGKEGSIFLADVAKTLADPTHLIALS
jgi:2-oxoisovalerate dehydrogenase E2 component (dihydrolipoyl transacylase)